MTLKLSISHSKQDSVVMAKEETYRFTEQKREPRNRHNMSHNYSQLIFDKGAQAVERSKDSLQQMVLQQLDIHM